MENLEVAMSLITKAGDSRGSCLEAIEFARDGRFDEARDLIKKAVDSMIEAHEIQTQLIRDEMAGNGKDISLLMVHAQDHLNLALITRDMAEEMIVLYERISRLKEK